MNPAHPGCARPTAAPAPASCTNAGARRRIGQEALPPRRPLAALLAAWGTAVPLPTALSVAALAVFLAAVHTPAHALTVTAGTVTIPETDTTSVPGPTDVGGAPADNAHLQIDGQLQQGVGRIARNAGEAGTVTVGRAGLGALATWASTGSLHIGVRGTGILTISENGSVVVDGDSPGEGTVRIATDPDSTGILAIGGAPGQAPTGPGSLTARRVIFGDGDGRILFNHNAVADDRYQFHANITGAGALEAVHGVTTLTGNNSYTGGTAVRQGAALVVDSDARLGEAGDVLTLDGGALLAAGSETAVIERDIVLTGKGGALGGESSAFGDSELRVRGDISGAGRLVIQGQDGGSLVTLTGTNSYRGGTLIESHFFPLFGGVLQLGTFNHRTTIVGDLENRGQLIVVNADMSGVTQLRNLGMAIFARQASAGKLDIHNPGFMLFSNKSSAGQANILVDGAALAELGALLPVPMPIDGPVLPSMVFYDQSSAGDSTITLANGAVVLFADRGNAGNAALVAQDGVFDFSYSLGPAEDGVVTAGSISGGADGAIYLGGNTFVVGNEASTEFAGLIADGTDPRYADPCGCGPLPVQHASLVKVGAGTLTLTGINTYSGGTQVHAGKLLVGTPERRGSVIGDLQVGKGATLGGSGTVGQGGTVSIGSGGTLAPGNSIGTLTVAGDLEFDGGATYEVEFDPDGSDRVDVAGTAALNGAGLRYVGMDGAYEPTSTYTILSADGGISGRFGSVTSNFTFLDPALLYEGGAIQLQLERNEIDFRDMARTYNQRATAAGAESLGAGSPVYDAIVTQTGGPAAIRAAFDRLSGEIHASVKSGLLEDSHFVRDAANARLRAASGQADAGAMRVASSAGVGGLQSAAADTRRSAAWGQAYGAWGSSDGDGGDGSAEFDRSIGGLLFGADTRVGGKWRVGVLAGYGNASYDADERSSKAKVDSYTLGAYAGTTVGQVGIRLGAAQTWHEIDTRRGIAVAGLPAGSARDGYRGRTAQVFGEAGYALQAGRVAVEPFAGLAYANLRAGGYDESGAAGLHGDKDSTEVVYTTLGARAATGVNLGKLQATVRGTLGWRHATGDVKPVARHAFAGGADFEVAGVPIARNAAVVEAGLDVEVGRNTTAGLAYQGQIGDGARQHGVSANVSVRF